MTVEVKFKFKNNVNAINIALKKGKVDLFKLYTFFFKNYHTKIEKF